MKKNTETDQPVEEIEQATEEVQISEGELIPEEIQAAEPERERIVRLLDSIENDVRTLRQLMGDGYQLPHNLTALDATSAPVGFMQSSRSEDPSIEGIFDGERMLDSNGKSYQVPPNYASKSKLVEGDPLKLYITSDGKYLYKQLGPTERKTIPGVLRLEGSHYIVEAEDGNSYNILTACVTYYMSLYGLKADDHVMIMIPASRPAKWAVIDNII